MRFTLIEIDNGMNSMVASFFHERSHNGGSRASDVSSGRSHSSAERLFRTKRFWEYSLHRSLAARVRFACAFPLAGFHNVSDAGRLAVLHQCLHTEGG